MPVKIGLTEDGQPRPRCKSWPPGPGKTSTWPRWERESDGKQDYLVARGTRRRAGLGLQEGIAAAIDGLPIPR